MPDIDEPFIQELMAENPEFRALVEDHQRAEARLQELAEKSFLSEEDELEIKQTKRHKLFLKDRMEAIARDHRDRSVTAPR